MKTSHDYSFSVNIHPSSYLWSELAEPKEPVQCYALDCNNETRYSILASVNDKPQAFLRVCEKHFDHVKNGWTLPLRRMDHYHHD